jgi:hypothetical protein
MQVPQKRCVSLGYCESPRDQTKPASSMNPEPGKCWPRLRVLLSELYVPTTASNNKKSIVHRGLTPLGGTAKPSQKLRLVKKTQIRKIRIQNHFPSDLSISFRKVLRSQRRARKARPQKPEGALQAQTPRSAPEWMDVQRLVRGMFI